jgi:two-component sensor histidine kinase
MITNTIKHASSEREQSEIHITFRRKQEGYQLLYCDNAPRVDFEKLKQGFGYNLIILTVRQLKGKLQLKMDHGLCYDILFDLEVAGGEA